MAHGASPRECRRHQHYCSSCAHSTPECPSFRILRPQPTAREGVAASAPPASKTGATTEAGAVQFPDAPICSPVKQSVQARARVDEADGAMDDAQQVLEESPARSVL